MTVTADTAATTIPPCNCGADDTRDHFAWCAMERRFTALDAKGYFAALDTLALDARRSPMARMARTAADAGRWALARDLVVRLADTDAATQELIRTRAELDADGRSTTRQDWAFAVDYSCTDNALALARAEAEHEDRARTYYRRANHEDRWAIGHAANVLTAYLATA